MAIVSPRWLLGLVLALFAVAPVNGATPEQQAQSTWRLLDYIAVDYREAVADGRVKNQLEYDEMAEFSATAVANLGTLPAKPERAPLIAAGKALQASIAARRSPGWLRPGQRRPAARLLAAIRCRSRPPPSRTRPRSRLYAENCASCHGAKGDGPSPQMAPMDPPPIAFADRLGLATQPFGLYRSFRRASRHRDAKLRASFGADRWRSRSTAGPWPLRRRAVGRQATAGRPASRAGVHQTSPCGRR